MSRTKCGHSRWQGLAIEDVDRDMLWLACWGRFGIQEHTCRMVQWLTEMVTLRGGFRQMEDGCLSRCRSWKREPKLNAQLLCAGIRWRSRCAEGMCSVDSECTQTSPNQRRQFWLIWRPSPPRNWWLNRQRRWLWFSVQLLFMMSLLRFSSGHGVIVPGSGQLHNLVAPPTSVRHVVFLHEPDAGKLREMLAQGDLLFPAVNEGCWLRDKVQVWQRVQILETT